MKKIYALLFLCTVSIYAQEGTMDSTFHFNGSNGLAIGPFTDYGQMICLQADGKMVVGGVVKDGSTFGYTKLGIARFDQSGELDLSFGTNGVALLYPNSQDHFLTDMQLDTAGNLLVLGTYGSRHTVIKLSGDGILDANFGTNGVTTNQSIEMSRLLPLPDGKFLISGTAWIGTTSNRIATIKRCLANGAVDTTFGTNGFLTIDMGTNKTYGGKLLLQPDGKIIASGYFEYTENSVLIKKLFLTRIEGNGTIDTTYGTSGYNTSNVTADFRYSKMNDDASFTVLGRMFIPNNYNYVRTKFDSQGNIIPAETVYTYGSGNAATLQPDGKMLFGGSYIVASEGNGANCFFARMNADGTPDATFGTNGQLRKAFSAGNEDIAQLKVRTDGKIYFVGNKMVAGFDYLVGRINSGLVLETETFSAGAKFSIAPNPVSEVLTITDAAGALQQFHIYDLQGRLMLLGSGTQINVSGLSDGVYVIAAKDADQQTHVQKFVKK